jgi:hypothetical protein
MVPFSLDCGANAENPIRQRALWGSTSPLEGGDPLPPGLALHPPAGPTGALFIDTMCGNDSLNGGAGQDLIDGGVGADTLAGAGCVQSHAEVQGVSLEGAAHWRCKYARALCTGGDWQRCRVLEVRSRLFRYVDLRQSRITCGHSGGIDPDERAISDGACGEYG